MLLGMGAVICQGQVVFPGLGSVEGRWEHRSLWLLREPIGLLGETKFCGNDWRGRSDWDILENKSQVEKRGNCPALSDGPFEDKKVAGEAKA